jgi:DUF3068 family protein
VRKIVGLILLGLGSFLLVSAVLATTWAPGVVKKTPVDVNNKTFLSGEAQRRDADTGQLGSAVPIRIVSITQADSKKSDDKVVVFKAGSCVVENADGNAPDCVDGDDPRLVSADESNFATDRVSGLAVKNGNYLPADSVQYEGLVNKWPFDAEKKTYPYWDGTVGKAVDAKFDGTEKLAGVDTYKYKINIDKAPIEVAEGIDGTYTNEVVIWVEPKTGAIQNQSQNQQRFLEDGTQVLNLQAEFTPEQIKKSAADTKDSMRLLSLITSTVPIVGFVGGALCLIAGLVLLLLGRSSSESQVRGKRAKATAGV